MDDTAQNKVQGSTVPVRPVDQTGQVQAQSVSQPSVQQASPSIQMPSQPVGSVQKEQAPAVYQEHVQTEKAEEYLKQSEVEPSLHPEVADAGVEISNAQAAPLAKQANIEPAKESVPVVTMPSGSVKLPMTEKEALKIIKTTSVKDSKHWLAVLVEKIYGQWRLLRGK